MKARKKIIRTISLVVILILMISIVGCKQQQTYQNNGEEKQDEQNSKDNQISSNKEDEQEQEEPVEITVWSIIGRFALDEKFSEVPYEKYYGYVEEKLGIKLNITEVPESQGNEALQIMISTNDLTDIVNTPSVYETKPDELFANDQIIAISDYDDYMPNYLAVLEQYPALKKNVMDDEGNILYFCTPTTELELAFSGGLMIRKDWVDKLGLTMPETTEEWINVLRAFRDQDPNENGEADELPFVGSRGSLETFANVFGVQADFCMRGGAGGEVIFGPFEEEAYKDRLKFMNTMYKEKLINQNYLNMDSKMRDTWMLDDKAGSTLTGLGNMAKWNNMLEQEGHSTFLMWPVSNPTYKGVRYFDRTDITKQMRNTCTIISKNAEHIEKCIEFLDFFYSEEGKLLNKFGVEGVTYEMEDGFPKYTDLIMNNPDGLTPNDAVGKYIGFPALSPDDVRVIAQLSLTDPASRQANIITWTGTFKEETNTSLPPAMMTAEEALEYASIMADVNTYIEEYVNKFVQGLISIDEEYDNFIKDLKNMNVERALEIQQNAVKRWQKRGGFDYEFTMERAQIDYWDKLEFTNERGIEFIDPSLK